MAISLYNHESRITALENKISKPSSGNMVVDQLYYGSSPYNKAESGKVFNLTGSVQNYDLFCIKALTVDKVINRAVQPMQFYLGGKLYSQYHQFHTGIRFTFPVSATEFTITDVVGDYNIQFVYGLKVYYTFSIVKSILMRHITHLFRFLIKEV